MSKPSQRSVPLLSGVIGGLLAAIGFFLPWYVATTGRIAPVTVSGWDIVNRYLTGRLIGAPAQAPTVSTDLPYAILGAMPLLVAVVAIIFSGLVFFSKGSPYQSGIIIAAGIVGLLSTNYSSSTPTLTGAALNLGNLPGNTGLGLVLMFVGYFGVIAGGLTSFARQP
jgi:hypothetical protein